MVLKYFVKPRPPFLRSAGASECHGWSLRAIPRSTPGTYNVTERQKIVTTAGP